MFYDKGVTASEMAEGGNSICDCSAGERTNDGDFKTLWWLTRHKRKYKMAPNDVSEKNCETKGNQNEMSILRERKKKVKLATK